MKLITVLSVMFLLFTVPAFSELTTADIEKIRSIIKEESIASEKRMKEYFSHEIAKVSIKIEEMDKRLTSEIRALDSRLTVEIRALDKRLDHIFTLVIALVAFIAVVIGIPQIIVAMQRKDIRAQDEKIEVQQRQIEALQQEIEKRKQEHIVRS